MEFYCTQKDNRFWGDMRLGSLTLSPVGCPGTVQILVESQDEWEFDADLGEFVVYWLENFKIKRLMFAGIGIKTFQIPDSYLSTFQKAGIEIYIADSCDVELYYHKVVFKKNTDTTIREMRQLARDFNFFRCPYLINDEVIIQLFVSKVKMRDNLDYRRCVSRMKGEFLEEYNNEKIAEHLEFMDEARQYRGRLNVLLAI